MFHTNKVVFNLSLYNFVALCPLKMRNTFCSYIRFVLVTSMQYLLHFKIINIENFLFPFHFKSIDKLLMKFNMIRA